MTSWSVKCMRPLLPLPFVAPICDFPPQQNKRKRNSQERAGDIYIIYIHICPSTLNTGVQHTCDTSQPLTILRSSAPPAVSVPPSAVETGALASRRTASIAPCSKEGTRNTRRIARQGESRNATPSHDITTMVDSTNVATEKHTHARACRSTTTTNNRRGRQGTAILAGKSPESLLFRGERVPWCGAPMVP